MLKFKNWIFENFTKDYEIQSQIDHLYDKAKYALKIVQMYVKSSHDPKVKNILKNVSTVAPLNSGVYGLYNSAENKAVIGQPAASATRFKFDSGTMSANKKIQKLPAEVIRQHIPEIDPSEIKPSDVIRVNIKKIVSESGDSMQSIIQIASTIVHEAVHSMEFRSKGRTDEQGPKAAEAEFMSWIQKNWDRVLSGVPQLRNLRFSNR
jgi:hypothetical protein